MAFAGLDILYLVTDDQLDARRRLTAVCVQVDPEKST
jgi:hypothetical protein